MRRFQKGLNQEIIHSKKIHKEGTPLLVSALTARSLKVGQVDLAWIKKDQIKVFEVKHPDSFGLMPVQYNRLKRSVDWLAKVFEAKISFEVLS